MNDGLTKTEVALLEALQRERTLLHQRDWVSGIILHELSNAVTVVGGSVDLLHLVPVGSTGYNVALRQLQHGSGTLRDLLAGLRVLIDTTGTPLVYEQVRIADFVRKMMENPITVGESSRIRLHLRQSGDIWRLSPVLMGHALGNIVRNALRYGAADAPVSVIIGQRGPRRWLHVLNRGPKIPPEVQQRLFEPGKKTSHGGMGLGLYIAQTCAERMGGRLYFGSTAQCTVFSLVLEEAPEGVTALTLNATDLAS